MNGVKSQASYKMLDSSSLSLNAKDVSEMRKEFMYFGHNAQTT